MADKQEGDDEELIPIVEGEEPEEKPGEEKTGDNPDDKSEKTDPPADAEGDDEHDDDDEDERLGDQEDGEEHEASASSKRRQKRRQQARERREEAKRELEMLRYQNSEMARRLAAVEGNSLQQNEAELQRRYQQTQSDLAEAEAIYAKAIADGQGDHALQALRIRDAAKAEGERIAGAYQQLRTAREKPAPDPRVASHARDWIRDNPWYDPQGRDEVSALTKRIDNALAAEGYNPASRLYWEELTSRVTKALEGTGGATPTPSPAPANGRGRNAPPMGGSSEHAPPSTRKNEIRVTPERKAAMVEAGVWDDPVRRQRVLREYQQFDKASAR